jgi:SAM-dependent methyltransferase
MAGKLVFLMSYLSGNSPWDTGITPPEVFAYLKDNQPGRMLDLGCGSGTNVITLAEHGWQAEGIDYVARAVRIARREAKKSGLGDRVKFRVGDVLSPKLFMGEYDLILDIGCFHNISPDNVDRYLENVFSHLVVGGRMLLYVHLNEVTGFGHGASEASLTKLGEKLQLVKRVDGEESARPSAWLEYIKDPNHRADSE